MLVAVTITAAIETIPVGISGQDAPHVGLRNS
jgi:hypothetical protein